jgi:hypothetical protein
MIEDIRKHLETVPFRPFRLRTADGHEYSVPTIDHIYLPPFPPSNARVVVSDDDGIVVVLPAFLISGLLHAASPEDAPSA